MSESRNEWAPLPIRLFFGVLVARAGYRKLFTVKGHANIEHLLEGLGVPAVGVMAWVVGILEFVGGLSVLTGTKTKAWSLLNVVNLLVNIVMAQAHGGFPDPLPGEQALPDYLSSFLGIGGLLSLFISGAGPLSVDRFLERRREDA